MDAQHSNYVATSINRAAYVKIQNIHYNTIIIVALICNLCCLSRSVFTPGQWPHIYTKSQYTTRSFYVRHELHFRFDSKQQHVAIDTICLHSALAQHNQFVWAAGNRFIQSSNKQRRRWYRTLKYRLAI